MSFARITEVEISNRGEGRVMFCDRVECYDAVDTKTIYFSDNVLRYQRFSFAHILTFMWCWFPGIKISRAWHKNGCEKSLTMKTCYRDYIMLRAVSCVYSLLTLNWKLTTWRYTHMHFNGMWTFVVVFRHSRCSCRRQALELLECFNIDLSSLSCPWQTLTAALDINIRAYTEAQHLLYSSHVYFDTRNYSTDLVWTMVYRLSPYFLLLSFDWSVKNTAAIFTDEVLTAVLWTRTSYA